MTGRDMIRDYFYNKHHMIIAIAPKSRVGIATATAVFTAMEYEHPYEIPRVTLKKEAIS